MRKTLDSLSSRGNQLEGFRTAREDVSPIVFKKLCIGDFRKKTSINMENGYFKFTRIRFLNSLKPIFCGHPEYSSRYCKNDQQTLFS